MFDRRSKLLSTITLLHDLGVTCVAFIVAYLLRTQLVKFQFFSAHLPGIYPFSHYLPLLLAFLLVWSVVGYFSSFYRDIELSNPIQLTLNIVSQLGIVLIVIYAGLFVSRIGDVSRTYVLLIGACDFVLLLIGRAASYSGVSWMRDRLGRYHYLLIIGCGPRAREMATLIEESRGMGLRLVGFVDPDSGDMPTANLGGYDVYPLNSVAGILQKRVVDEIVFAVNLQELARLEPVMQHCADLGIRTRVQLEFLPAAYSRVYLENFREVQLLSLSSAPDSELRLFFKRIFDVVLSLVSLLLLSPLLLCIAAMIRITSPGPVLFQQTRCGLGGRRFTLYKFRSMINNAEQMRAELHQLNELDGPVFKISDDPRITHGGALAAPLLARRVAAAVECLLRRNVVRRPAAGRTGGSGAVRGLAATAAAHASRADVHVGAGRPQPHRLQSLDAAGPEVHRQLVAMARHQDFLADDTHRALRPGGVLAYFVFPRAYECNSRAS